MQYNADTKQKLIPYIIGKQNANERPGRTILNMFCSVGLRDVYKDGFPLHPIKDAKMSKKEYIESRLDMIDDQAISQILTIVVNEAESEETVNEINNIISADHYLANKQGNQYVILGNVSLTPKPITNEVHFKEIEAKVLLALDKAKVSIRLVMAWFTNDNLQQKLIEKLQEGLDIKIIIFKDGINQKHGVDLTDFEVTEMRGSRGGIMHNKFCVLDNQVVISGSYNWSDNAEFKNDENVNVTADNAAATESSLEFKRLINAHHEKLVKNSEKKKS